MTNRNRNNKQTNQQAETPDIEPVMFELPNNEHSIENSPKNTALKEALMNAKRARRKQPTRVTPDDAASITDKVANSIAELAADYVVETEVEVEVEVDADVIPDLPEIGDDELTNYRFDAKDVRDSAAISTALHLYADEALSDREVRIELIKNHDRSLQTDREEHPNDPINQSDIDASESDNVLTRLVGAEYRQSTLINTKYNLSDKGIQAFNQRLSEYINLNIQDVTDEANKLISLYGTHPNVIEIAEQPRIENTPSVQVNVKTNSTSASTDTVNDGEPITTDNNSIPCDEFEIVSDNFNSWDALKLEVKDTVQYVKLWTQKPLLNDQQVNVKHIISNVLWRFCNLNGGRGEEDALRYIELPHRIPVDTDLGPFCEMMSISPDGLRINWIGEPQ